jgi:hypothetical protein
LTTFRNQIVLDSTSPTSFRDRRGSTLTAYSDSSTSPIATSGRTDTLRDSYFANAKDYQQFVEEYQLEQQNNKLEKFLFNEN